VRLFNACGACRRQYDVTGFAPGTRLACQCGATFDVEHRRAHAPRALKCSNCGGVLAEAARKCEYCAAEITLEERRLDSLCPECSARMASDARFCMECGVRIDVQALAALPAESLCPRCKGSLRTRAVGATSVIECQGCGGLWLGHAAFEGLCQRTDEGKLVARSMPAAQVRRADVTESVAYLPCPTCRQLMNRKNYGGVSGVILDVCREHGVWLDHAELEKVLRFIESGGLDHARRREVERLEEKKRRAESTVPHAPYGGYDEPVLGRRWTEGDLGSALGWIGELLRRVLA
jgi:Zn-finger nucleic acid-binding protein